MSYTQFRDSYAQEAIFKTSIITDPSDTPNILGAVSQNSIHPSPVALINYTATGYNLKEVSAGLLWKGNFVLRGMYGLRMQNGILCWAALGLSSTAGADPYTHTITPTTDGSKIPSFTINHEQKGSATDEEYQFLGCTIDSLTLVHDMKNADFLMAKVEWMAAKAQDGIALTADPALPATSNSDVYENLERKWDSGGTPVSLDGLQHIEINIINGLNPIYAHTWDTGVYTGQWVQQFLEAKRKQYRITMLLHPNTIERALWDELIATGNTKDATFKWIRSANDYILVTASDCQVVEHQLITPEKPADTLLEQVVLEPRALSIEVKDSIAGGAYGE